MKAEKKTTEIRISYNGNTYTLAFNRKTVVQAEDAGFSVRTYADKPLAQNPILFRYSFGVYHPQLLRFNIEKIDEIYENTKDIFGLCVKLAEMYANVYQAILSPDDEEEESKNGMWEEA